MSPPGVEPVLFSWKVSVVTASPLSLICYFKDQSKIKFTKIYTKKINYFVVLAHEMLSSAFEVDGFLSESINYQIRKVLNGKIVECLVWLSPGFIPVAFVKLCKK